MKYIGVQCSPSDVNSSVSEMYWVRQSTKFYLIDCRRVDGSIDNDTQQ